MDIEKVSKESINNQKKNSILKDYVIPIVVGVIVAVTVSHFFGRGVIHGESMMPTLKDGQSVLIVKSNKHIKKDDIVFIHCDRLKDDIVKRVIAVGGDNIKYDGTDVYVNGEKIDDSYTLQHKDETYIDEMVIPDGYIYVLGDNRDNSTDSRILGNIDIDDVFAEVILK